MADELTEIVSGEGWAAGPLDAMGEGPGFRKIRHEVGVTEFGVNAIILSAGAEGRKHTHEHQQELYICHEGALKIEFGDGEEVVLGPGGVARVDASTVRLISNPSDADTTIIVVGGKGGYVERDGKPVED
ncbi:MAG: cupin domain-containing protein [bacterium]